MATYQTTRFGEIEVEEEKIIHFKEGLPAFEDEEKFIVVPYEEGSPYVFLQSLQTPYLAFLMAIPFLFFPNYQFELTDEVQTELGLEKPEDLLLYVMVTIPKGTKDVKSITANLLAPIVINARTRLGKQVVLEKSDYQTKHLLFQNQDSKKIADETAAETGEAKH